MGELSQRQNRMSGSSCLPKMFLSGMLTREPPSVIGTRYKWRSYITALVEPALHSKMSQAISPHHLCQRNLRFRWASSCQSTVVLELAGSFSRSPGYTLIILPHITLSLSSGLNATRAPPAALSIGPCLPPALYHELYFGRGEGERCLQIHPKVQADY